MSRKERKEVIRLKLESAVSLDDDDGTLLSTRKAVISFTPDILQSTLSTRLDSEDDLLMQPYSRSFMGVCLIADISGFTRLSGAYCARGTDGIDDLQKATSGYMGSLVNTIYLFGGDVIKFAGDALICVFKPSDNHLKSINRVCAQALKCSWELKDLSTDEFSLHVAISSGLICFGLLGGFDNMWECLISGSCITQLSQCLEDCPSKHVVVTREVYESITRGSHKKKESVEIIGDLLDSTNYMIKSLKINLETPDSSIRRVHTLIESDLLMTHTARYIPRPVTQALMAGSFDFLAELREVYI